MKQVIKIRRKQGVELPKIIPQGEWIDLAANGNYDYKKGDYIDIDLGVAMKMPAGMEAPVIERSSTFRKYGIILVNGEGLIDNPFQGNENFWHFFGYALRDGNIKHGDKIAQFRIQLSQKATVCQKLKWLFSNGVEIQEVDNLTAPNRGDSGSTDSIKN